MKHKRNLVNCLPPRQTPLNQSLITGTLMLALGLPLASPMAAESQASDTLPDFSDSLNLTTTDVAGDGFLLLTNNQITPLQKATKKDKPRKDKDGSYLLDAQAVAGDGIISVPLATGSKSLIDQGGLEWFVNTDITFATSSSASAAASDATFTHSVTATTSAGGTEMAVLSDAFDGYNTLCVSLTGATGPCTTGDPDYTIYNQNGPATFDVNCDSRQLNFAAQTIGSLQVSRKMFVPSNDTFARWLNIFTNTGSTSQTLTAVTANNLGSDSNTRIVSSSDGNTTASITDTWVSTFQNYSTTTSPDPRLGHVLQGPGASVGLANIYFTDGVDSPYWAYTFTLKPGETKIIMNFATGQPSKAAANAKAAELVGLPVNTLQCMTPVEKTQVVNFKKTGFPWYMLTPVLASPNKITGGGQ
ncbi:MAG: hypothetical protein KKB91_05855 [Proteobacteria bacterium]|nr:hypothetical protein [Pseudomonadota bacterium]MCG2743530.1 hypothetical protein [Desulfobacteraceae bacterium]